MASIIYIMDSHIHIHKIPWPQLFVSMTLLDSLQRTFPHPFHKSFFPLFFLLRLHDVSPFLSLPPCQCPPPPNLLASLATSPFPFFFLPKFPLPSPSRFRFALIIPLPNSLAPYPVPLPIPQSSPTFPVFKFSSLPLSFPQSSPNFPCYQIFLPALSPKLTPLSLAIKSALPFPSSFSHHIVLT